MLYCSGRFAFADYILRSVFYAHRITGDPRWAEYNWQIFQAIQSVAKNDIAYATVNNVNAPFGESMSNNLDSCVSFNSL